jgi:predicted transposase YbfD/YdcC
VQAIEEVNFMSYFEGISDPRKEGRNKRYPLREILLLVILAVICGADSWVEISEFGEAKLDFLRKVFPYEEGIPSHDTLGTLFSRLCPKQFQACFLSWIQSLVKVSDGEIIAIDGKAVRRSYRESGKKGAIHIVSAWASKNQVVLGQRKVDDKSNEITAIPELLKVLDIKGCTITIDAMGCQRKIAEEIFKKEADYVFSLKGNQANLHEKAQELFDATDKDATTLQAMWYKTYKTIEKDHGRIETRIYTVLPSMYFPQFGLKWKGLQSLIRVYRERQIVGGKAEPEEETSYYISSLPQNIEKIAHAIRTHWQVENQLHWTLDLAFREDECRVRKDYAPENLAVIRHIALNLLKQEKTSKVGIKIKRSKAGWDEKYLASVLGSMNKLPALH